MEMEHIELLVKAIAEHAIPREYDENMLKISLTGTLAAVFSCITAGVVFFFQHKIIKNQINISETQNKISLFKDRYDAYSELYSARKNASKAQRFLDDESDIVMKNVFFKDIEINSLISFFGANILLHRMSKDYISTRVKTGIKGFRDYDKEEKNKDIEVTSNDNQINDSENIEYENSLTLFEFKFFLDNVDLEVEDFIKKIMMIPFIFKISDEDEKELNSICESIINIKKMAKFKKDKENEVKEALYDFCELLQHLKIIDKIFAQLTTI